MNMLQDVRDAAVDSGTSLSDVLRKAKVLASLLRNDAFKEWVDRELNGYPEGTPLPDYRSLHFPLLGTFSGPGGSRVDGQGIPTINLPESLQHLAGPAEFRQGVREVETMAHQGPETLRMGWPPEAVMALRDEVAMSGGFVLIDVYQPISSASLHSLLDAVRNRLLDFVLELEEIAPGEADSNGAISRIPQDQVANVFNLTIHGDHSIIASGTAVSQRIVQVPAGDTAALNQTLRDLGIDDDDIEGLESAIQEDQRSDATGLGAKTKKWIGEMTLKAAEGSWQVALETAPTLLSKILSQYLGLGS